MSPEERPAPVTIPTPEGYIGKSVVRREAARLLAGRGVFTDDLPLPGRGQSGRAGTDLGV